MIKTGSWFTPLPEGHIRVGISRGTPRGQPAGYRRFADLAPGVWFNSVPPQEYLARYTREILAPLHPQDTLDRIIKLADGKTPVICCYESPQDIATGAKWCHRHIAGQWLQDRLGIEVTELGAPEGFDPWGKLRAEGINPPSFTS